MSLLGSSPEARRDEDWLRYLDVLAHAIFAALPTYTPLSPFDAMSEAKQAAWRAAAERIWDLCQHDM